MKKFPWFIFNGKHSYNDLGIIIKEMSPIVMPKRDIESIQVEGSNRILHIDKGAYKSFPIKIKCTLIDFSKMDTLKQVFKSLGEIELSDNPGRKYKCRNTNQINFSMYRGISDIREFTLNFELEPIAYGEEKTLTFTSSSSFNVSGTDVSNPIVTITGTGTITLNGKNVQFLETGVTLDCENMEAYKNNISKNDKVVLDEFPQLIPGTNSITIPNTITNVGIVYHERWL